MPQTYSKELLDIIKAMLHQSPDKRPSVARILRNPYIKKHIAMFLEGTRARFDFWHITHGKGFSVGKTKLKIVHFATFSIEHFGGTE